MWDTLPILYRDEMLVAVHKPAGLLVHRTFLDRHATQFAVQIVRNQIGRYVYPVHRIDRGTSGVLLFSTDKEVCKAIGLQFTNHEIKKSYLAVVRGYIDSFGTIDHPLSREFDNYEANTHDKMLEPQPAVSHYQMLDRVEIPYSVDRYPTSRYSLVKLTPVTGRKHQLRRHLKHISHPIIGDATYGKGRHNRLFSSVFSSNRLLLASTVIEFTHPCTGELVKISCPLSDDFCAVIKALGWNIPERYEDFNGTA